MACGGAARSYQHEQRTISSADGEDVRFRLRPDFPQATRAATGYAASASCSGDGLSAWGLPSRRIGAGWGARRKTRRSRSPRECPVLRPSICPAGVGRGSSVPRSWAVTRWPGRAMFGGPPAPAVGRCARLARWRAAPAAPRTPAGSPARSRSAAATAPGTGGGSVGAGGRRRCARPADPAGSAARGRRGRAVGRVVRRRRRYAPRARRAAGRGDSGLHGVPLRLLHSSDCVTSRKSSTSCGRRQSARS